MTVDRPSWLTVTLPVAVDRQGHVVAVGPAEAERPVHRRLARGVRAAQVERYPAAGNGEIGERVPEGAGRAVHRVTVGAGRGFSLGSDAPPCSATLGGPARKVYPGNVDVVDGETGRDRAGRTAPPGTRPSRAPNPARPRFRILNRDGVQGVAGRVVNHDLRRSGVSI